MMIGQQAQVRPVVSTTQAVGGTPLLMYGRDTPHNLPSSLELSTIQVKDLQLARRIASLEAQIAPSFSADRFRGDMPVAYLNQLRDHHIPSVDFSRVVLREPSPYLLLSSRQEFIERPISFPPASKVKSGLDLLRDASVVATAFTTTRKGNEDLLAGQSQSDSRRQHFMGVFSVSDQIPVPDDAQDTASDGKMYIDTIQEWDVLCGEFFEICTQSVCCFPQFILTDTGSCLIRRARGSK